MFGLLFKLGVIVALVAGGGYLLRKQTGTLEPQRLKEYITQEVSKVNPESVKQNVSATLDSLVSNPKSNSPMVLGVKITNDSLDTVISALRNLPPDQVNQIKSALCAPLNTPSPSQSAN